MALVNWAMLKTGPTGVSHPKKWLMGNWPWLNFQITLVYIFVKIIFKNRYKNYSLFGYRKLLTLRKKKHFCLRGILGKHFLLLRKYSGNFIPFLIVIKGSGAFCLFFVIDLYAFSDKPSHQKSVNQSEQSERKPIRRPQTCLPRHRVRDDCRQS